MLAKFEKEYSALLTDDYVYMVKGLNSNLDKIFSYKDLSMFVEQPYFLLKVKQLQKAFLVLFLWTWELILLRKY